MAYNIYGKATGTVATKLTLETDVVEMCKQNDIVLSRLTNYALGKYISRLQHEEITPSEDITAGRRLQRNKQIAVTTVAVRLRRDLYNFVRMNMYSLNACVRAAISTAIKNADEYFDHTGEQPLYTRVWTKNRQRLGNFRLMIAGSAAHQDAGDKETAQNGRIVNYLSDSCKHARFKDGMTKDCCGHCIFYTVPKNGDYKSTCARHG